MFFIFMLILGVYISLSTLAKDKLAFFFAFWGWLIHTILFIVIGILWYGYFVSLAGKESVDEFILIVICGIIAMPIIKWLQKERK